MTPLSGTAEVVPVANRRDPRGFVWRLALRGAKPRGGYLLAHRGNRAAGTAGARSGAVLEAPALVAGLDDLAMMGETVEQGGGHLGVAEDRRPFAEGEVGGDDDRGSLVEPAHEVEEQLPAGLSEGQVAEFVEDDEVAADELVCGAALASGAERLSTCPQGAGGLRRSVSRGLPGWSFDGLAMGGVVGETSGPVEEGEGSVWILMDPDRGLDVVVSGWGGGDLEDAPSVAVGTVKRQR